MEMWYWALQPLGRLCARLSMSAAQISWLSLLLGLAAGITIGAGHAGLGAAIATCSLLGDALDGMVARIAGSASDRGELLDAAVDRYVEMFLFGGIAVAERASVPMLVLTLAAFAGAMMVSYATAKAEALRVVAPRGIMRRTERTTLLVLALVLSPLAALVRGDLRDVPLAVVLTAIGVLANVSVVHRLFAIARAIRTPEPAQDAVVP
jgi:phosphatidylglycerophosphate synthase